MRLGVQEVGLEVVPQSLVKHGFILGEIWGCRGYGPTKNITDYLMHILNTATGSKILRNVLINYNDWKKCRVVTRQTYLIHVTYILRYKVPTSIGVIFSKCSYCYILVLLYYLTLNSNFNITIQLICITSILTIYLRNSLFIIVIQYCWYSCKYVTGKYVLSA